MNLKSDEQYYWIELLGEFSIGNLSDEIIYSHQTFKRETISTILKQYNFTIKKRLDDSHFILVCDEEKAKELKWLIGDHFRIVPAGSYINEEYLNTL